MLKNLIHLIRLKYAHWVSEERDFKNTLYKIKYGKDKEKVSTTKIVLAFLILNMVVIEVYSLYAMLALGDLNALPVLITAIVGECISILGYMVKSSIENKSGGIVFETTMKQLDTKQLTDDEDVKG